MLVTVPERTLEMLAEMEISEWHEDRGPGYIYCPACGERANMRWDMGYRLDSPKDVKHDRDCPAEWARTMLELLKQGPKL